MQQETGSIPASLHSYIGEILKSTNMDNTQERMKNEWARYITFASFPRSSPVHPSRLAQSGFYYSGSGDETVCFSCGLKYRNWKQGDSPFDIHKKLSPTCDFVNGSGNGNIPIRGKCTASVHGATSLAGQGEKDMAVKQSSSQGNVNSNNQIDNKNNTNLFSAVVDTTGKNEQSRNTVNTCNAELGSSSNFTSNSSVQEIIKDSENMKTSLSEIYSGQRGIDLNNTKIAECLEKPKYQHYSALTSRLESFRGWPSYLHQKPTDLATAGFYYVGVGDCVRCFFCGGGLRNWEEGDVPWEEHERWFPDCVFLKQFKRKDFVMEHLMGVNLRLDNTLELTSRGNVKSEERSEGNTCHLIVKSEDRQTDATNPMNFPAAQSVLSMGYDAETIKQAIEIMASRKDNGTFSATDLLEIILEREENETKSHPSADSYKGGVVAQVPSDINVQHTVIKPKEHFVEKNEQSTNDPSLNHAYHVEERKNYQSQRSCLSPEELKSLIEQNQELKDQATCKICMDREACIVFLPCCHMMSCHQCAQALNKCPVCRQRIKGTVRAYIP